MGGKSSSSNKTSTKNTSSQNAISGDNLGVALSGIEGSTINATVTDHGSIEKSFNFAGDALDESLKLANGALKEYSSSNSENLQMIAGLAGNQAAQNTQKLRQADRACQVQTRQRTKRAKQTAVDSDGNHCARAWFCPV